MSNHEIDKEYSEELRKIETTDPVHADTLNPLYGQLINNDAYLKEKVNEHKAENATEAHDGISILNDNITVTVGDNGDYSTINEALNYLTTKYPAYKSVGNVKATINLLSGFVMSEQVIVNGLNLGWIEIVGEDAETTIDRSALTINFAIDDYGFDSFPAFGASEGGMLPIIGQLFVMDDSGDSTLRDGVVVINNSRASIRANCGVKNAGGNGILATRSSTTGANGANFSGAGVRGVYASQASTIEAFGADASGAGEYGVCASFASMLNANQADASGAGERGVYANQSSTIEAWGADASGAGEYGVYANQASTINAINVNARKIDDEDSSSDIRVGGGSFIKISDGNFPTLGGTNQTPNELTRNGIIFM